MIVTTCNVLASTAGVVLKSADDKVLLDCCECVARDVTEISTLTVTVTAHGVADACGCTFDNGGSVTAVFNRINQTDTFNPALKQFKLYFVATTPTHCDLVILIQSACGGDCIDQVDIPVDGSVCGDCICRCRYTGHSVEHDPGKFLSLGAVRAHIFITNGDCGGTLLLGAGADANLDCNGTDCDPNQNVGCSIFTTGVADNTVNFTYDHVPGVSVTISQEETLEGGCTSPGSSLCDCVENCEVFGGLDCFPCGPTPEHCPACSWTATVDATVTLA